MKSHPGFEKIKKDKLSEYYSSVDLTGVSLQMNLMCGHSSIRY